MCFRYSLCTFFSYQIKIVSYSNVRIRFFMCIFAFPSSVILCDIPKCTYKLVDGNLAIGKLLAVLILLDLTQLTSRSSCPSSERWASQEPRSCGLSLTTQIGPSGCLGGVRFRRHNFLLLESLKAQCLDRFSSLSTCRR